MANFFVDYNKAADASTIMWTHEDIKIEDAEPFVDFIRCDLDGEEYKYLYSDQNDFKVLSLDNFGAISGDEEDTFILCYTAEFEIDLQKHTEFKKALEFSSNLVEVVIGFKKDGKVLEDCFEENANRQAELQPSE